MRLKISTVVAIDPGVSNGGIAIFTNGRMRVMKNPKTSEDIKDLMIHIKETYNDVLFIIEKVQAFSFGDDAPGKKFNINKMLKNYTELITTIKFLDFPIIECHPLTWQRGLNFRTKKDPKMKSLTDKQKNELKRIRKQNYKNYAQEKYPAIKVTLWSSDAICLCDFLLLKYRVDPDWIEKNVQNLQTDVKYFEK
jgi:hypothetical protein